MSCHNETRTQRPCEGAIDPMGGATIPPGFVSELVFVNGEPFFETDPAVPPETLPVLLLNQRSGGILIDEGIYLAITGLPVPPTTDFTLIGSASPFTLIGSAEPFTLIS